MTQNKHFPGQRVVRWSGLTGAGATCQWSLGAVRWSELTGADAAWPLEATLLDRTALRDRL